MPMDIHEYARKLQEYKRAAPGGLAYFGAKWIALKSIFGLIGAYLVIAQPTPLSSFGVFLLGYVLGVVVADLRTWRIARSKWVLQVQLLDWQKIDSLSTSDAGSGV